MGEHPLVGVDAEETEEDAHAGRQDAAAQAVQRVGQAVVAGSAEPVDDEFERDERQEDRDRETYCAAIRAVHVDIVAQTSRLAPPTTIEDMEAGQADIAMELRERLEAQRTAFRKSPPGRRERVDALRRLEQALLKHKDDSSPRSRRTSAAGRPKRHYARAVPGAERDPPRAGPPEALDGAAAGAGRVAVLAGTGAE